MKKRIISLLFCFLFSLSAAWSQTPKTPIGEEDYQNTQVEMADKFRADGKIYVVVAVILTILGGIFVYLFALDKKIKHLEKMLEK